MKNKTMTCVLLSEEAYKEDNNIIGEVNPHDYHENSAKITTDGIKTYCKMEMVTESIQKHLEDKSLSFSKEETILDSKEQENGVKYTFVDKKNKLNIVVLVPEELISVQYDPYPKYDFVSKTLKNLSKLNKNTNKIRNIKIKKGILATVLATMTLVGSYMATTKIVNEKEEPKNETKYTDFDKYYRGIINEEQYNENANNLQEIADKVLKK